MVIEEDFKMEFKQVITMGEHNFEVVDVNIRDNVDENTGEVFSYVHYDLMDMKNKEVHRNLMSTNIQKEKGTLSSGSDLYELLTKFGVEIGTDFQSSNINKLIGKHFSAYVTPVKGFPKIDIPTIVVGEKK